MSGNVSEYVNSSLEIQEQPFKGDIHIQQTYHLEGSDETLNIFTQSFFIVTIEEIRGAFRN